MSPETENLERILNNFGGTQTEHSTTETCPRCGKETMHMVAEENTLSQYVNVYICNDCVSDEAIRSAGGKVLPFDEWDLIKALFNIYGDKISKCF